MREKQNRSENPPKELHLKTWMLWEETVGLMSACTDSIFSEIGLPTQQFVILNIFVYVNNKLTVNQLAQLANRKPNSISMIVNRMERDGLVKRVRDSKDRRVVYLTATTKGLGILKQALKPGWEFLSRLFADFTDEEMQSFISALQKFHDCALKEMPHRRRKNTIDVNYAIKMGQKLIKSGVISVRDL